MASGEKLPNTNLNLIQDTDMIDYADINAIAQAVEANATNFDPVEAVLTADKFSTDHLKLYRIGRLCVTTGFFRFTQDIPTGGNHTLGMVPEGFRPPVLVQTWSMAQATKEMVLLVIASNGTIAVYNYGAAPLHTHSGVTANLTWITNG